MRYCSITDCKNKILAKSFCSTHYSRLRKFGDAKPHIPVRRIITKSQCDVDTCDKPHKSSGYCGAHYYRLANRGRLDEHIPIRDGIKKICSIYGCDKYSIARSWCSKHYERWKRHGSAEVEVRKSTLSKHKNLKSMPEYQAWYDMVYRCTNPKNKRFKDYGGRGITICKRWINSFDKFYDDMGKRPSNGHSLDRIDNNGNYEPDNCRWATREQQYASRRPRNNIQKYLYNDRYMSISEIAKYLGITSNGLMYRIKTGNMYLDKEPVDN